MSWLVEHLRGLDWDRRHKRYFAIVSCVSDELKSKVAAEVCGSFAADEFLLGRLGPSTPAMVIALKDREVPRRRYRQLTLKEVFDYQRLHN